MFDVGDRVRFDGERTGVVVEKTPSGVVVQLNDGQGPAFALRVSRQDFARLVALEA
jgi:hypothetical protein